MFSQSSLASPSSLRRRASTCMLSRLFRGLATLRSVRYCCGVWHATQFLAGPAFSRVQAGHAHCPAFSREDEDKEEEEEEEEAAAQPPYSCV